MRNRATALTFFLAAPLLWLASSHTAPAAAGAVSPPQRRAQTSRGRAQDARRPRVVYTNFDHATAQHREACDSCHKFPSPD